MKLPRRHTKRGRVEIIQMIDTILILLIFYMSFSSFKIQEKRIDARLPMISAKVAAIKIPLDVTVHVRNKNEVILNGTTTFDLVSLRDAMQTLGAIGQEATVVIEAEPDTNYRDVIGALDACALAKLKKVAFRPLADKGGATP